MPVTILNSLKISTHVILHRYLCLPLYTSLPYSALLCAPDRTCTENITQLLCPLDMASDKLSLDYHSQLHSLPLCLC